MSARTPGGRHLLDRRYRLLEVIGKGQSGRVFKALHTGLDALVAIKELRPPSATPRPHREAARAALFAEARRLTTLSHPNIPRILDYFSYRDTCFLVTDFVDGQTLAARPRSKKRLPLRLACATGADLCDAVAYLHSRSPAVVLNGLTAADVILSPQHRLCIVDLGVARRFMARLQAGPTLPLWSTSPAASGADNEQAIARDLRALATLMSALLSGQMGGGDMGLQDMGPETPPAVSELLVRMLEAAPDASRPTAEEAARLLRAAARAAAAPRRPSPAPPAPASITPNAPGPLPAIVSSAAGSEPPSNRSPSAGRHELEVGAAETTVGDRSRRLLGVAAIGVALFSLATVVLASSLAAGNGGLPSDSTRSQAASLSGAAPQTPLASHQQADSNLAGPPAGAYVALRPSRRLAPPTPTAAPTTIGVTPSDPTAEPQPTDTPSPVVTPSPTATLTPEPTVIPTDTPEVPTDTSEPTPPPPGTPMPIPTVTDTPQPPAAPRARDGSTHPAGPADRSSLARPCRVC